MERRSQILGAFARVLAHHGYAGATIAAVAAEADVAPGLVHHHFDSKADLIESLLRDLVERFRERLGRAPTTEDPLVAYVDAALKLDERADLLAARCWVGVFAEAVRDRTLFGQMRRVIDTEIVTIRARSGNRLSDGDAGAVLAFVIGSLVLGAFAPRKTVGFASPAARRLLGALLAPQ